MDGLFDKLQYLIFFPRQNGECDADRQEPLSQLFQFLKPFAALDPLGCIWLCIIG